MEAKEKAIEIINKFKGFEMTNENYAIKQTASIVVDEILLFLSLQIGFYDEKAVEYFKEVKKEIHFDNSNRITDKQYKDLMNAIKPR